jgi:hypothetical protein
MAVAQPTVVQMELGEFVSKLVLDAFTGVTDALRLQEEQHGEMAAAATLEPLEFANATIPDEEVDRELARLFPSGDSSHPHAVYVGAPFQAAAGANTAEKPAFQAVAGVNLVRADFTKARGTKAVSLGAAGVKRIREATRLRLGAQAQTVLRAIIGRGIPRVLVDSGRISAKVSLGVQTSTQAPASRAVVATRKDARFLVRMVDSLAPQNQQLAVDIMSELEIRFKTVT